MHLNTLAHKIINVYEESLAYECGIRPGDFLVSINDKALDDIFDYYYLVEDEFITLNILKENGETEIIEVEKDMDEDLGLEFESALLDDYKSCNNKCIFCFIDQMPPGMRDTLYFKDDDTRLSFLQGNYVTLTNLTDEALDRIIDYRLAPINISVHATDPDVRIKMLNNRFAGDIMNKMRRIADNELPMNAQIVLCKGINDEAVLDKSINDLLTLWPYLRSVSVVPVGLTKFRDNLFKLKPFDNEDAKRVLKQIEDISSECKKKLGVGFVYASDEWYIMSGKTIPEESDYDGYPQLENGVGMMRLLMSEFYDELYYLNDLSERKPQRVSIATGELAATYIEKLCDDLIKEVKGLEIKVYPIRNDFFGNRVTVSGLVTGTDLINQLKGKDLGERLLLPINMLRSGEDVFLDDISIRDVKEALDVDVVVVDSSGVDLLYALLGE